MELIGYRKFTSKKNGKEYHVINVMSDYTDRELNAGCVGRKCEELFLPNSFRGELSPSDIGKEVLCVYEYSGGRAFLVSVELG